jgi:hypothetical protein
MQRAEGFGLEFCPEAGNTVRRANRECHAPRSQADNSSCCRLYLGHNLFLKCRPSLSETACSWFMIRVRSTCRMSAG